MPLFSPVIKAFERLRPSDGLLITAESWQRTQDYHRQRQNFYYQSLHQAGIVRGLGVTVVAAPADVEARYRNQRWVQVQPGMAIDAQGNPIVVTQSYTFQVQSICGENEQKTVYLVLNYVDPVELRSQPGQDWVRETFRIVEKTFLDVLDVELCRIQLTPGSLELANSTDVLAPGMNALDLRYRQPLRDRPEGLVRVAHLTASPMAASQTDDVNQGFSYLFQAMVALYPALGAETMPAPIPLTGSAGSLPNCDLVYLSYRQLSSVSPELQAQLKRHGQEGGVLLIAADEPYPRQQDLVKIKRELEASLMDADTDPSVVGMAATVRAEIAAIEAEMTQFTQTLWQSVVQFAAQLELPLSVEGTLPFDHPLQTIPFLFSRLPEVAAQPIQLLGGGSVLLVVGDLAEAWRPDQTRQRSREAIRSAHEIGINLLYYAWRRRHLVQCQHLEAPGAPTPQPFSLTTQVTS